MHTPNLTLALFLTLPACAQQNTTTLTPVQSPTPELKARPKPTTPKLPHLPARGLTEPDVPATLDPPTSRTFTDPKYKVAFTVPAGWNFEKKDGLLSNFGVDTATVRRRTDVRGVAALNFNPWPVTTFASALFYYSVLPRTTAAQCAEQTTTKGVKPLPETPIDSTPFHHGYEHHGKVCTEARDDVFAGMQGRTCLRFDLVINTFCAETSGAMEINQTQINDVEVRLGTLLSSVTLGQSNHGDDAK